MEPRPQRPRPEPIITALDELSRSSSSAQKVRLGSSNPPVSPERRVPSNQVVEDDNNTLRPESSFITHDSPRPEESGHADQQQQLQQQQQSFHGDWRGTIKEKYLSQFGITDGPPKDAPTTCRGAIWRFMFRFARLPWTAILLVGIAVALISVFIVFIVNGPSSTPNVQVINGTQVISSSTKLVTVQCETDVTKEECAKRASDIASSQDFQQAMTETHLFTTLIIFWLAATIFFVIKAMRTRKRNRYLESLPRTAIPVWADLNVGGGDSSSAVSTTAGGPSTGGPSSQQPSGGQVANSNINQTGNTGPSTAITTTSATAAPVNSGGSGVFSDSTSYMVSKLPIHSQMERSFALLRCLKSYDPFSATSADRNWGGHWKGTHFPTTVRLSSYQFLESKAMEYDPALRMRRDQTVRDWLKMLKSLFPTEKLNHRMVDAFLDFYERARFGEETIDERCWLEGMSFIYELGASFDRMRAERQATSSFTPLMTGQETQQPNVITPPSSTERTDLNVSHAATAMTDRTFLTARDSEDIVAPVSAPSQSALVYPQGAAAASSRSSSLTSSSSSNEIAVRPYNEHEEEEELQPRASSSTASVVAVPPRRERSSSDASIHVATTPSMLLGNVSPATTSPAFNVVDPTTHRMAMSNATSSSEMSVSREALRRWSPSPPQPSRASSFNGRGRAGSH